MNLTQRRFTETAAMMMIGDGALGLIQPSYHCLLWKGGARWWRDTVGWFAERPQTTRAVALAELAAGLWIGLRQETAAVAPVEGIRTDQEPVASTATAVP